MPSRFTDMNRVIGIAVYILILSLTLTAAGNADYRAFIWDSMSGMRDVPVHSDPYSYDAFSYAEALNNLGEVIGWGPYTFDWKWNSISGEISGAQIFPVDINDHGEIVGSSSNNNGGWIAYLSNSTGLIDLGKLQGDAWASPCAINNSGQVVGDSARDGAYVRPFIWDRINGMRQLAIPEGFVQGCAYGINDSGIVAGKIIKADWTDVAAYWNSPTDVHIIGSTGDGDRSEALGINSSGQIVGRMRSASTDWRACIWDIHGNVQVLGTLPGCDSSGAAAINDKGQVAGTSEGYGISRAFIWDCVNGMRDLGDWDGGASYAADINNNGQICGSYAWQKYLPCSIGEAKRMPYDTCVEITDAVVVGERHGYGTFVESSNRISGMLLVGMGPMAVGARLSIHGVASGGCELSMYEITNVADGQPLAPLGVTSLSLKPKPFDPEMSPGLDMTGILVRLAGTVTAVDTEQHVLYVDDGGTLQLNGAPMRGIKVYIPEGVDLPEVHSVVAVTGVGLQEPASLGEQMKIGQRAYPAGTPVNATSIVCREAADITTCCLPSGLQ